MTERTYDRLVSWHTVLDNYEPIARGYAGGKLEVWEAREAVPEEGRSDLPRTLVVCDAAQLKDAHKGIFLIDDGHSVVPWYVTGWNNRDEPKMNRIFLHMMPVNFHPDGTPVLRGDRPEPVSFDTWILGPRRAWHLKIDERVNA